MNSLNAKQLEVALMLASGETVSSAASKVGVARQTIHDWLSGNNVFMAHLNGLKKESVKAAIASLQNAATLAVTTVCELMTSSKNDAVRLACAIKILEATHVVDRAYHIGSSQVAKLDKKDSRFL